MPSVIHFKKHNPLSPARIAEAGYVEMGVNTGNQPFIRDENGLIIYLEKSTDSFLATQNDLVTNSGTVFTSIDNLSFPVEIGKKYRGEMWISFSSALASNGIALSMLAPSGRLIGLCSSIAGADGTAALFSGALNSSGDSVISASVQTANIEYLAKIEFIFIALANGVVTPRFRAEVNGNNVTVFNGSILTLLNY